jgi:hypothetical protein
MSITIPTWFVQQFSATVHQLAEQKRSKLLKTITEEPDFGSEAKALDRIGTTQDAPDVITTRHGDTPEGNTPHTRRWLFPTDYDVPADFIDKQDKVKLLIDPTSQYVIRHSGVMGRGIDDAIVTALGGSALEGQYGPNGQGVAQALPSEQKIAHGSTGLTLAKLIEAQETMDEDDIDPMFPRFFVGTPKQRSNLLQTTEVTNSDYATVKALVNGQVNEFMGFTFIWISSGRLPTIATNIRGCYAYAQTAIRFGFTMHPTSSVDVRHDKRNSMQVYTQGSWGAVRIEDELVIEVACDES